VAATVRQSAANAVGFGQSRTCAVTLNNPTVQNNLIVVFASCSVWRSSSASMTLSVAGFTEIVSRQQDHVKLVAWYREGAPSLSTITVTVNSDESLQMRVFECAGVRQSGSLDRVVISSGYTGYPDSGATGSTTQADSLVLGAVANLYETATQYGFTGGLSRLYEGVSTSGYDADHERTRMTTHQLVASIIGSWRLKCYLSTSREWTAFLCTFKGGSSGPARFASTAAPNMATVSGSATLTAFGPLKSTTAPAMMAVSGTADILPFDYQYRINWASPSRVLIGADTDYPVAEVEGLEGWQVRTSDDDLPRNDGAIRGIDLQSARQVLFTLGMGDQDDTRADIENKLRVLFRALIPQRDTDWEMVYRHPGQLVKMIRARPNDLVRGMDPVRVLFQDQKFALRAADPRHYSPVTKTVTVAVAPATSDPVPTEVINVGDSPAYPLIRIVGPPSGANVTRLELVDVSNGAIFDVQTIIPPKSVLVGDMEARVTSAPRSIITLDGQSKYGAWQLREPFYLAAHPEVPNGSNLLYLRTTPAAADVTCTITYRDSWAG